MSDERSREEPTSRAEFELDPDYYKHGGFPKFEPARPGPGFGRFLAAMRRAQDLAVSANPDPDTWTAAADRVEELVALLAPSEAAEGVGPANRVPSLPGAGSLLMPPYHVSKFDAEAVELTVSFGRFHVGGNYAVHGGVLPLLFDSVFGMVIHATGRPISRTAFLHVDYRNVTPINTELTARGWLREAEGRKAFVNAELIDPEGTVCAEAHGLMVRLLPGQP
ncbi:PaaI family thioesterase [Mycobacterium sp. CVI_P3]|uniref:Acyl-coenzyme A thioesterase THEM4 n=1 Tax=Mycobacterium pinniadriaticum TaxID=2994102 RepID=A0ABT3SI78_9MYCO|nr:PaaI family thioesterase [Mycobacterium pinniadriaticum]MCX2932734.1 PaaI family thioesterase [Mycobacterium pinniadriaticum]MCX2939206.1 PaaI family thioesterase [Mycobacterium pinniadriaticum]